jgi:hypothetical protein
MKTVSIGRNPNNSVVISDAKASRYHCSITQYDNGICQISDMGSLNGTYVNGHRITGTTNLLFSDVVRVGDTVIPWQNYISGYAGNRTMADPNLYPNYIPNNQQVRKEVDNSFGITAMVLGICGISLLAIIFGIVALCRHEKNRGFGLAGLISGIVWSVIYTLWVIILIITEGIFLSTL